VNILICFILNKIKLRYFLFISELFDFKTNKANALRPLDVNMSNRFSILCEDVADTGGGGGDDESYDDNSKKTENICFSKRENPKHMVADDDSMEENLRKIRNKRL